MALFALFALVELAALVWVGSEIGLSWVLGIAIATASIGFYLVRRAGLSALRRIRDRINQGQIPGREISDGAAILVAGALLISPGFISDVLGFLMLIPAVRASIHRTFSRRISARVTVFTSERTLGRGWPGPAGLPDKIIDIDPE